MKLLSILIIFFAITATADKKTEESIKKQLKEFYEKMASGEEEVRKKALTDILPDVETFKLIMKEEEAKLFEAPMKRVREKMLAKNEKIKEEFARDGKVISIKLTPLKEEYPDSKFLKTIKFPVYSVFCKTENGGGSSSAFFLANGKLKKIERLQGFDQAIEKMKQMQKK